MNAPLPGANQQARQAQGTEVSGPLLCLIAAVARNGVIGRENQLPWHLPQDLQHFRRTTAGAPVIMGRKTWDSLPPRFRPLPGRCNVVVTHQPQWQAEGALRAGSLDEAVALAREAAPAAPRVFVIGGTQLYAAALPRADALILTEIDREFEGDAHFPAWNRADFEEVSREPVPAEPSHDLPAAFVTYRRKA